MLGANGIIAQNLSRALVSFSPAIRQASRNPRKVNPTDDTVVANLLDSQATANAASGSEVVYLVAGFPAVPLRRMLFERLFENQVGNIFGKRPVKLATLPLHRRIQLQETVTAEFNSIVTRG